MSKVYIEYNPYTVETLFKINDEEVKTQPKYKSIANKKDKRLQYYLEADNRNWQGLIKELIKLINSNNLDIEFKGRKIDYEDLEYSVLKYKKENNKCNINLKHLKSKEDKDINKNFRNLIEQIQTSTVKELQEYIIQNVIKEGMSTDFKMSVLGSISSGKTTLINTLVGNELLLSSNTACMYRIRDNDKKNEFTVECRDKDENVVYNKKVITFNKENMEEKISPCDIKKYNNDKKVMYIDIEGSIPEISSENMNLVLQDIPTLNSYENYKKITDTIINDKEIVLYVMNATQFETNNDKEILEKISEAMKNEGKDSKDRFMFILNKCDEIDLERESLEDIIDKVKNYLKYYKIENPNIFPVSAQMAKLIRMYKQGFELTKTEKDFIKDYKDYIECEDLHFEKLSSISRSNRLKIEEKLNKSKENDDKYEEVLIHTGITSVELAINEYLEKYAYPIKIQKAIEQIQNFIEKIIKKLDNKSSEDRYILENIENIKNQVDDLKNNINKVEVLKYKINKFISHNLDLISNKLKLLDIEVKLNNIIDENKSMINNKNKVEKNEARMIASSIKLKLNDFEKNSFKELKESFNENILKECKVLLKEYYKYIENLGYDTFLEKSKFHKIVKLKNANIKDIDTLIDQYKKNEYYIDIEELIKPKLKDFQETVTDNIDSISNLSNDCIQALQCYFKEQIEEIDKHTQPEIKKLDRLTNNYEKINKELKENQYRLDNMNCINMYLQKSLEI